MREFLWGNMKDYIRSDIKDKILDIRLERQHKKNALTEKMYIELSRLISDASDNTDINVILISGEQDFTAGNDLEDFISMRVALIKDHMRCISFLWPRSNYFQVVV